MSGGHLPHRTWPDKSIRCICSACVEVGRLRAELAQVNGNFHACRDYLTDDFDRANKAEAAIARVREELLGGYPWDSPESAVAAILRAIEGEQT